MWSFKLDRAKNGRISEKVTSANLKIKEQFFIPYHSQIFQGYFRIIGAKSSLSRKGIYH